MLRQQRSGLVQTEQQYKFLYSAVAHFIDTVAQRHAQPGLEYANLYYNTNIVTGGSQTAATHLHQDPPPLPPPLELQPPPLPKKQAKKKGAD